MSSSSSPSSVRAKHNSRSLNRSINRIQQLDGAARRRSRAGSRAFQAQVSYEDAYNYALSIALLHYLLQPKKKKKEYVTVPKAPTRVQSYTHNIGDLLKEFIPTGGSTVKLPRDFRGSLEKRMERVVKGTFDQPGYSDPNVKRTFAEAYTNFTEHDFRKTIDRDRTLEPLILKFYAAAVKAMSHGRAPDDHSWKILIDRHLALFVRLMMTIFKKHGTEKDKELMARLQTLEQKLLRNDQDLFIDTGQDKEHKTIEVDIPHSYEVKDMYMVQIVGRVFGRDMTQLQSDIDLNKNIWTEEAALKDLKAYQHRLDSNMDGALRKQDFDLNESFEEWKKGERDHITSMMLDILKVRPDLAKTVTSFDKPLPVRPTSIYGEDQSYADLAKMLSNDSAAGPTGEPAFNLNNISFDDNASIRSVDEASYTFIPPEPRAYYKTVLQHAMTYDQAHPESEEFAPLSHQSFELLIDISSWWRLPQFSRHITFLEVAVRKFLDQEFGGVELDECFEFVKNPQPEPKKLPRIQLYTSTLTDIDPSRWTLIDYSLHQQILAALHSALLRELYDLLMHCYEPKAPTIGVVMSLLLNHVYPDPVFVQKDEDMKQFSQQVEEGLKKQADQVYHGFLEKEVPAAKEDWNFSHVVNLGSAVTKLCQRIKKKYAKNPEIMGVSPFAVLVQAIFPSFEEDAKALIETIVVAAKDAGLEVNVQDGFDLYKELVEVRKIHIQYLPGQVFAFDIEGQLEEFVWRWISDAESRMTSFVEEAIKQDQFQVRTAHADDIPTDTQRHSVSIIDVFQLFNQTAEQIFQLHWDNDVHHAKFMTSLAKAFSAGIGRYCEIVESKFAKEMDRQSAAELAAAQRTAQERIMQMAKDAWNQKEKIEPFQFYPESFVKLNNIEYAMQSLDKLERLMNVDACAELLLAKEGPRDRMRKPDKYVFTVKVIEAEDIKACDPNGYSDPYVVLVDEYQKRLAKTRVVSRTLNPRWDESVDVTVTGPVNVIATIWDYDTFGDHDFVGRTSLKLDPVHFSDYLPREFWLDLDTQGRLLIRVSMEGEKDDIQFHFGKAFRHLKRTERDMVRKITDKLSTVINASLSHEALKNLLSRGIAASIGNMWKTRKTTGPSVTQQDIENALQSLFNYFDENFAIMKQTLTDATMLAVMTRLWKEVLMAIESLLVPPLSDKPSTQKPLTQVELDVVYKWLELLFEFFNAKDEDGEVLGVPAEVLKSPKWHELASLNFWYFDSTDSLIRTSERMVAATQQRAQQQAQQASRQSAPAALGPTFNSAAFGSMGTIRRGKSIMMSRNLGTMKRAKEEKRKEAQADPSDDMILRILRMRAEAAGYLRERHRQKERMAASQAAAAIVRQSIHQGFSTGAYGNSPGGAFGRGAYGNLPRR